MNRALTNLVNWAKRNERWLSSLFFLGGFVGDIAAFTLLEVDVVNLIFAGYLVAGAVAILIANYLFSHHEETPGLVRGALVVLLPLFVQYVVGSILSGSLIFYTKSATLTVSWPFLLLIAIVFFGNEVFRNHREHVTFQTLLFFFGLYAYVIFALPLILGRLGPDVFLWSSAGAGALFCAFLLLLYRTGKSRLGQSIAPIVLGTFSILLAMNAAYFTGVIPPLPLGLKDSGIYHTVHRTPDGYALTGEAERPWYRFYETPTVHHVPGTPLYAYSAVFAPIKFSAGVEHVWERYDEGRWKVENRVAFPVSGGRLEGYRGYTEKSNPRPGSWRVSVRTIDGQTIGRISFEVVNVEQKPPLVETVR